MELAVEVNGGGVVCWVQAVGLQGSVAKGPHGPNRTPEVCGQDNGRYVSCDVCMTGRKYEKRTNLDKDVFIAA